MFSRKSHVFALCLFTIFCNIENVCAQAPPSIESVLMQYHLSNTIPELRAALENRNPDVRALVAKVLATDGDVGSIPLLREALKREHVESVRLSLANSLAILRDREDLVDVNGVLVELANPATTVDAASRLVALGNSQPRVREVVSDKLPAMLLQTKNISIGQTKAKIDVVQSEAKVAGALKLVSTIPSLIQLLRDLNMDKNTTLYDTAELLDDPVARALYDIGKPALPALKKALKSPDIKTRQGVEAILLLTNTPESRAILRDHLPFETDGHLRIYLRENGIRATH